MKNLLDIVENNASVKSEVILDLENQITKKESGDAYKIVRRKKDDEKKLRLRLRQHIIDIMYREGWSRCGVAKGCGIASNMLFKVINVEGEGSVGLLLRILDFLGYEMKFEVIKKESY
jgi:hypothetical protein